MRNNELEIYLQQTLADLRFSDNERSQLRELGLILKTEEIYFMRNRAFELAKKQCEKEPLSLTAALKWLEQIIKTLDLLNTSPKTTATAYFSPRHNCYQIIQQHLKRAQHQVDICVFTIADNRISEEIASAFQRGVNIRIITDDEKTKDLGSDIDWLRSMGITIATDNSSYFMHHKFALFDNRYLLNGSFNWTRTASEHNQENILIIEHPELLNLYCREFNQLWQNFYHT